MKYHRQLSSLLQNINPHTEYSRLLVNNIKKLTDNFNKQFLKETMQTTEANLTDALLHLNKGKIDITLARKSFEDAIQTADIILNYSDVQELLNASHKSLLSKTYSSYADFLRRTKIANPDTLNKIEGYYEKALQLDPNNQEALATRDDLKYTYRMT